MKELVYVFLYSCIVFQLYTVCSSQTGCMVGTVITQQQAEAQSNNRWEISSPIFQDIDFSGINMSQWNLKFPIFDNCQTHNPLINGLICTSAKFKTQISLCLFLITTADHYEKIIFTQVSDITPFIMKSIFHKFKNKDENFEIKFDECIFTQLFFPTPLKQRLRTSNCKIIKKQSLLMQLMIIVGIKENEYDTYNP